MGKLRFWKSLCFIGGIAILLLLVLNFNGIAEFFDPNVISEPATIEEQPSQVEDQFFVTDDEARQWFLLLENEEYIEAFEKVDLEHKDFKDMAEHDAVITFGDGHYSLTPWLVGSESGESRIVFSAKDNLHRVLDECNTVDFVRVESAHFGMLYPKAKETVLEQIQSGKFRITIPCPR